MNNVTIYYLEATSPDVLQEKQAPQELSLLECEIKEFRFNKFLYRLVGESWQWVDKLSWSDEQWRNYAENDNLRTWVAYHRGSPAGYFELQQQLHGDVEIVYFGLAPRFIGCGFGGYLLSRAIRSAWTWNGTKRVWVHTCSLDHPGALQNYRARGMKVYRIETVKS